MSLKNIILLGAALMAFTACEGFLSEMPTKGSNQPVKTAEQLNGLLDGFSWREENATMAYSTDDCLVPVDAYDAYTTRLLSNDNALYYTFTVENVANRPGDAMWTGLYSSIYTANLIIEYAGRVSGDAALKARVKAEAHFLRAYSYWVLANYYCLPYAAANMQEPGLPRKVSINDEEDYSRMTLAQTYDLIDSDLTEALKVDVADSQNTWRADRASVNAFLSRYYLFRGEYDKAVTAADYALSHSGTTKLRDYNTLVAGSPRTANGQTIAYCETNDYIDREFLNWEEFFYVRLAYSTQQMTLPSPELLALYTEGTDDMRYKWFMLPNGTSKNINGTPMFAYSMFGNGAYAFSGPTVQEVMLNRAEALLRQASPDIPGAIGEVNKLRDKRIAPGTEGIHLSAATKEEALAKVLEERRRELPFGFRWWDIRRLSVNETTADDITVTRSFHPIGDNGAPDRTQTATFSLPVGSRRYALPINATEIALSQGRIGQNTY